MQKSYDSDGCRDITEDADDDNDGICDIGGPGNYGTNSSCNRAYLGEDLCPKGFLNYTSTIGLTRYLGAPDLNKRDLVWSSDFDFWSLIFVYGLQWINRFAGSPRLGLQWMVE